MSLVPRPSSWCLHPRIREAERVSGPSFRADPSDRVVLIGHSGSGKSTMLRALTSGYRHQVVIDAKHEETLARSLTVYTPAEFARTFPQRARRVVFRPDPEGKGGDDVDEVMRRVLHYGRTALVVHDGALYASSGAIVPAYRRAQLIGRTIQVPVWTGLQRPVDVHNVLLSEANHVFLFALALESDRTKVAGIVGRGALEPPDRPFAFGYYGPSTAGVLIRCDPLEVPNDSPHDRESRDGDDHGDGRHLRDQGSHPDGQRPRSERPGRRHLAPPPTVTVSPGPDRRRRGIPA
jgi:energy-coupling factor transporter ATP-binding protein EcfA2